LDETLVSSLRVGMMPREIALATLALALAVSLACTIMLVLFVL